MSGRGPGTAGGARLRALREQAGRTQLWVELEAELGAGYLQRVESGKVALPERVTVERVLDALHVRYGERRDVLRLFGYAVTTGLPGEDDIAWACEASGRELAKVEFPAYVLDCAHRLIAWNSAFPRLLGIPPNDPLLGRLARRSLLALWFDPTSSLGRLVAEPDAFLPALMRAMRHEMGPFGAEAWYAEMLTDLMGLPRFRHYREVVERETAPVGGGRALVPVRLAVPGVGLLQFRLAAESFTRDPRFRAVYYFPADSLTMRACATWAASFEGSVVRPGARKVSPSA